jgi:hypothetical protein
MSSQLNPQRLAVLEGVARLQASLCCLVQDAHEVGRLATSRGPREASTCLLRAYASLHEALGHLHEASTALWREPP